LLPLQARSTPSRPPATHVECMLAVCHPLPTRAQSQPSSATHWLLWEETLQGQVRQGTGPGCCPCEPGSALLSIVDGHCVPCTRRPAVSLRLNSHAEQHALWCSGCSSLVRVWPVAMWLQVVQLHTVSSPVLPALCCLACCLPRRPVCCECLHEQGQELCLH
jgi:hypothetical protein